MKHNSVFQTKRFKIALILIAGLLLTALAVFLWRTGLFSRCGTAESLRDALASFQPWSALVFFALQLCSVVIAPIPSNLVALAGGLSFGIWKGFLITILAVNLGSSITFLLGRALGRDAVQRLLGKKVSPKYLDLLRRKRDTFLVIAFLFPFFPDDILCILASFTEISWKRFAVIVLLTRHWGLLAASALGGSLFRLPPWALPLAAVGGTALMVLGLLYGDRIEDAITAALRRGRPAVRFPISDKK